MSPKAMMVLDILLKTGRRASSGEGGGLVRGDSGGVEGKKEDTESAGELDSEELPGLGGSEGRERASSALCTKWQRGPYGQNPTE